MAAHAATTALVSRRNPRQRRPPGLAGLAVPLWSGALASIWVSGLVNQP